MMKYNNNYTGKRPQTMWGRERKYILYIIYIYIYIYNVSKVDDEWKHTKATLVFPLPNSEFFALEKSRGSSGGCRAATRSRAEQRHTIGQKARSRSSRHVPASYQEGINKGICEKRTSNLVCRQSC